MSQLSGEEAWRRLTGARVATLATVRPDGTPHAVPVTFAVLDRGRVATAVDAKPKRSRRLQRVANLVAEPQASILADRYDDADWSALWWVRVDGFAEVVDAGGEFDEAVAALEAKYSQYRGSPPVGPAIVLAARRITGWAAR